MFGCYAGFTLGVQGGYAHGWISQWLEGCRNVAELSISLLTCLKLCGREFQPHCGIFGDSKISTVDIIVSRVLSMRDIQSKNLMYCDLAGSILYRNVDQQ